MSSQQSSPPQQGQQPSEQLQKLVAAANGGQLSGEQISQLRNYLSSAGQLHLLSGALAGEMSNPAGHQQQQQQGNTQQPQSQQQRLGVMPNNAAFAAAVAMQQQQQQQQQGQGIPLMRSPGPAQQQQQQQPMQQQQMMQQQYQQGQQAGLQQPNMNNAGNINNGQPAIADPRAVITSMQTKITNIEQVLTRNDLSDVDRQRLQIEHDSTKRQLGQFVAQMKAAHKAQSHGPAQAQAAAVAQSQLAGLQAQAAAQAQQHQQQQHLQQQLQVHQQHQQQQQQHLAQNQQQQQGPQNGAGPAVNDMQIAQARAMALKAQQLQAQLGATQNMGNVGESNNNFVNGQQQQPNFQQGQVLPNLALPASAQNAAMRRSPNLQPQLAPGMLQQSMSQQGVPLMVGATSLSSNAGSPPQSQLGNNRKSISAASGNGSQVMNGLTPQQQQHAQLQAQLHHHQQQQAAAAAAMAAAQGQNAGRSTPMQGQSSLPPANGVTPSSNQGNSQMQNSGTSSSAHQGAAFPIPDNLNMSPQKPEAFPRSRPTLTSGLPSSSTLTAPAITKAPQANLPANRPGLPKAVTNLTSGNNAQPMTPSAASATAASAPNLGPAGPLALKNSEGRPYSKRKLQELMSSIDPTQVLDHQVEDVGRASRVLRPC